ncbi:DEMETER-like protein 3 [Bidens hawaiensis]|uniref:DEMETER-like protein 3 n=1 Tax=Bidens hawaiensis TaxID=980011 RepID=UPI00404AD478
MTNYTFPGLFCFKVDRHVCRIVVRLGWVPLETLPDGVLLHQLNEYPNNEDVQEYLSQRLSILDVDTLYELHYQMITFGKVFCTKTKPNCNSCPLKNECKHFASASTSGGEKASFPTTRVQSTPELVDIEDLCLGPMVRKTAGRLRTKHQVYELPDAHPLVQRLDKRDPNDENPYLLAVWPPVDKSSGSQQEETMLGAFLVPHRTATRGSFPLDGTYFQTNEAFSLFV